MNDTNEPEAAPSFRVVPARKHHAAGMAACYAAAFPTALLSAMGPRLLMSFLKHYIRHAGGFGLVALDGKTSAVAGMIFGGDPKLRLRFFITRSPLMLLTAAYQSVMSTGVRRRILYHLRTAAVSLRLVRPRRYSRAPTPPRSNWGLLQALCVHPDYQRRGLGEALTRAFVQECVRRGYAKVRLTTEADNTPAIKLYVKCGWKLIGGMRNMRYFSLDVPAATEEDSPAAQ